MKGFKKLALVSAVAALPMSGFAMEAMDDASLSGVTGQDGISIAIDTNLSMDIIVHDVGGFAGYTGNGAIVITGMSVDTGADSIEILVDAGTGAAGAAPVLNIEVIIPDGTEIETGDLTVAASNGLGNAVTNESAVILDSMTITLGEVALNIQLGNEIQNVGSLVGTHMIAIDTTITDGISISNFSLNDANSGGSISATAINIVGNGVGDDVEVAVGVNATTDGLVVAIDTLGSATGLDIQMERLVLGGGAALGDVEIRGLNLNGTTLTISGKL